MSRRRVAVTGMGVVSPLGCTLDAFWSGLINGRSGACRITRLDPAPFTTRIGAQVVGFDIDKFISKREQRRMDSFCHFGIAAARMAVEDSGLEPAKLDGDRVGVVVGSGIGGLDVLIDQMKVYMERGPGRFSPFMIPQMIVDILSGYIAIEHGFRGPNFCITSACATATHCIGESTRMIQHGEADVMVAGGAEGYITILGLGGFCALRALTTRNEDPAGASRPFDADRDGFLIGEGAGVLILEEMERARARGARIYGEVVGYGRTCDANHITAPDALGQGARRSMTLALEDAQTTPAELDYINAHGTSTELNDKGETLAIKGALGEEHARRVMISSTKSMTGHTLGAAGGIEAIACMLTMRDGVVHPTINYQTPDPDCDLDYVPNTAREAKVRTCLSNSFGFGGHNGTLCFKAVDQAE